MHGPLRALARHVPLQPCARDPRRGTRLRKVCRQGGGRCGVLTRCPSIGRRTCAARSERPSIFVGNAQHPVRSHGPIFPRHDGHLPRGLPLRRCSQVLGAATVPSTTPAHSSLPPMQRAFSAIHPRIPTLIGGRQAPGPDMLKVHHEDVIFRAIHMQAPGASPVCGRMTAAPAWRALAQESVH